MVEKTLNPETITPVVTSELFNVISQNSGVEVANFISENIPLRKKSTLYFPAKGKYEQDLDCASIRAIIDLRNVNYARDINMHFSSINKLLPDAGIHIGCFESYNNRRLNILKKTGKTLFWLVWILDVIFNRVLPKIKLTRGLYKLITRNRYNVISVAETLGRAVYCGFEVLDFKEFGNLTYFAVIKTSDPKNDSNPSFGPLFKMRRIGKNGKIIGIYKLRTMHPYSEYLQEYVVKLNGYDEAGKPRNDFRVTNWGKFVRKFWLDELPQLINLFKGELGLVGVRPLSQFRFNQLPEDVRKERIKFKPGCIPPYVALNMPDAIGNIEAERIYISEMKKNKVLTSIRYFFLAIINILTRRIQSA